MELINYWDKNKEAELRRKCIFNQMPKDWDNKKKILYTAIALEKISNKVKDKEEKRTAKRDSEYYYNQLKQLRSIGI